MKAVKGQTGVRLSRISEAYRLHRLSTGLVTGMWCPTNDYLSMHPKGRYFIRNDVCNSQLFILLFEE